MKHLELHIVGKVQGVFYRASAQELALKLQLTGYAQNEEDGSVHIEAEGEETALQSFLEWNRHGPERAEVKSVDALWSDALKPYTGFKIL